MASPHESAPRKSFQRGQLNVNTAVSAKDGAQSPDSVSPGVEKDSKVRRFLKKVQSGLMAKKFNQTDHKVEKSYEEFIKTTSVKSHTGKFTL